MLALLTKIFVFFHSNTFLLWIDDKCVFCLGYINIHKHYPTESASQNAEAQHFKISQFLNLFYSGLYAARYVIQTWRFEYSLWFLVHAQILDRKFSDFLHKDQIYPVSEHIVYQSSRCRFLFWFKGWARKVGETEKDLHDIPTLD